MPTREIRVTPMGEILDMIACMSIAGGAKEKKEGDDEEMIPDLW